MAAQRPDVSDTWPTGFMLIQGNRLEQLRDLMVTWMRRYPLGPLEDEVVLVQSNGIAQWLKLALAANPGDALSGGCGIAAALEVTLPARFIWQAYRAVLGDLPEASPFDKGPLTWRLYRLLGRLVGPDQNGGSPATLDCLAPLKGFLDGDDEPRRRYQLAERLADLFDQYQVYRADWLGAWRSGDDVLIRPNGQREPVPEPQRWQPVLWRALAADVAAEAAPDEGLLSRASRAEVHRIFLSTLADGAFQPDPVQSPLPRRVIVFGISSLPRQMLEVLEALSARSQVMLFVLNPSHHYWGDIIEGRDLFRQAYRRNPERKVPEALDEDQWHLHGHPLLAAWGKQGRDYIRLLDEHDARERYETHFHSQSLDIDLFESPGQSTLLQQIQDDILELRPLHERRALAAPIDPGQDRSLEFLIAHGPQREVEILHDRLLDAFESAAAEGRPLQPRDLLVMVPDIDVYAPHIQAVFGRLDPDDPRHIPFNISDQGQRRRNPLLIGLEALLGLPRSRFAVSELLDLLDVPALRERFGIAEPDLPRLRQWISGANIRWGLDAAQRASLGLPDGLEQCTWRFGLRRMLLGFAAGAAGAWQGVEPYDEIGGLEAALVGPLAQLLQTLDHYWQALQLPRAPADWAGLLSQLLDDCFEEAGEADGLAIAQVEQALEQWVQDCRCGGLDDEALPLEILRESLLTRLDQPTLTQRFLAGSVNFATLMPMRAIPFRQIWLLGMNDGDYPRNRRPPDFDLMARDYRPGDRSRREDDRYLFLEALLSAREKLVISWVGRSIRDNSPRPPSVLVGQLRDHIAAGWVCASEGEKLLDALTTEHPLQPFSRSYFAPKRPPALFTYASEWRGVHDAGGAGAEQPPVLPDADLEAPIRLDDLAGFLRHPVKTFYAKRLGVFLGRDEETPVDEETFHFDGLQTWGMQDGLIGSVETRLRARPRGAAVSAADSEAALLAAVERLGRAGHLPLPPFDAAWKDELVDSLAAPLETYCRLLAEYPLSVPAQKVQLDAAGLHLEDVLNDLLEDTDGRRARIRLQASRLLSGDDLKWYHLVRHWPAHLAAQLQGPVSTILLGPETHLTLPPQEAETARTLLGDLLAAYRTGLAELQPLACRTGFEWLRARLEDKGDPIRAYEGGFQHAGEVEDHPGYARFWPSFESLSADRRFESLVDRLYLPLLTHLRVVAEESARELGPGSIP